MSRKRLPKEVTLVLDEKLVNLLRYHQLFEDELAKPQKKAIYVSSMLYEQSDIGRIIVERLAWLFSDQFPRSRFVWGAMKKQRKLPDKMPKELQREVKLYAERNGLPF